LSFFLSFNKGFPGSIHDITIARISGIVDFANQNGEAGIGDKAYQGEKCFFTPIKQYVKKKKILLNEEEKRYNKSLEKYRNNVERVNNRIKIFKSTREKWRHSIEEHSRMIYALSSIVNLSFIFRPLNRDDEY
jgi:hypothetical protein